MLTTFPVTAVPLVSGLMRPDQAEFTAEASFRQALEQLVLAAPVTGATMSPPSPGEGSVDGTAADGKGEAPAPAPDEGADQGPGEVAPPAPDGVLADPMAFVTLAAPERGSGLLAAAVPPIAGSDPVAPLTPATAAEPRAQAPVVPLTSSVVVPDAARPDRRTATSGGAEPAVRRMTESGLSRAVLESRFQPGGLVPAAPLPPPAPVRSPAIAPLVATMPPWTGQQPVPILGPDPGSGPETGSMVPVTPVAIAAVPVAPAADGAAKGGVGVSATAGPAAPAALIPVPGVESPADSRLHARPDQTPPLQTAGPAPGAEAPQTAPGKTLSAPLGQGVPPPPALAPGDVQTLVARAGAAPREPRSDGTSVAGTRPVSTPTLPPGVVPTALPARDTFVEIQRKGPSAVDRAQPESAPAEAVRGDAPRLDTPRIEVHRPVAPAAVTRQIADSVPALGGSSFDLALNPEELGQVRLRLSAIDGGSLLLIHAERPETLDMLRRHIATLEQDLRDLGHVGLTLRFSGGGAESERGYQPPTGSGTAADQPPPRPESPRSGTSSPARDAVRAGQDHLDLRL